jgi:hypothetical protein
MGKYQVPITYNWASEIAVGGVDAEVVKRIGEVDANPDNEPATSVSDGF